MKCIVCILYLLTFYLIGYGQSMLITGRVIDENQSPIPDASIMVYSQDSVLVSFGFSDSLGEFCIQTDSIKSNKIKISCLGFKSVWKYLPIDKCIELTTDSEFLSEVVIKGKRNFTKQTTSGFVYDLSNINFIKGQNLLQAIRVVPFVDIDSEGQISVNGNERCLIYHNGKPFDMAMTNPRQILQSLQAKDVNKIEIVTERDFRFGNNIPVINIITSHNSLNGVYCNGEARYKTTPNVKAGASLLAKNDFVDFSLSYNYDYQSQHNQPIYQHITTPDNTTTLQGKGDGNWHTHIFRALTSLHFDSLNVVYADIHAKINKDSYTTRWFEQSENSIGTENDNLNLNQNWATKGALEANMIYRNYFKRNSNQEHFSIGYRYAYNPDKRNYIQTSSGCLNPITQKTAGGINEHTLNLLTIVPVSRWHQFSFGARTIYRKGEVNSSDNSGLSYSQSITYPYINYTGHFKWLNAAVNLNGEYEYLSMCDEYKASTDSKSNHFYFLPSVKIYRSFDNWNINISYNRNLQRPSMLMLNPFCDSQNGYFQRVGNPDLEAEIKDNITLGAFFFKKRISMSLGLTYSHTDNAILYYQKEFSESGAIISSYDNIGRLNTLTGNIFVNWQPVSALVLKCNINGGLYNLSSGNLNLYQKDYTLNVFGWIDYYFPKNWNIGCNVMHFKQAPEPFGTVNSITNYSIHIDKTWMGGALSTSVELATPFSRYSKFKTKVSNPMFSTEKINYIIARYFGVSISYTFQQGKKSNLKRDSSLINSDQNSGVQ